jgi:hypothetical protein
MYTLVMILVVLGNDVCRCVYTGLHPLCKEPDIVQGGALGVVLPLGFA